MIRPDADRPQVRNAIAFVLGGGKGTRLFPLTRYRSKPAVPLAGRYRLIDIPISNCINSGLNRIYVLTQFNSVGLHRHIRNAFNFDPFGGGFVEILAAQQTLQWDDPWYQGTADAVRKNLHYAQHSDVDFVLILSGDQLYRMDYNQLVETHSRSGADVTIAALPVHERQTPALGILQFDGSGRVTGFHEKPKSQSELQPVRMSAEQFATLGVDSRGREYAASMGIYLFRKEALVDLLQSTDMEDFGKQVFPLAIRTTHVHAHLFDGYWEDIGTIPNYYETNLALAGASPPIEFGSRDAPIYTRPQFLPPARIEAAHVSRSLICDGCVVGPGAVIENCVIGPRCRIEAESTLRNSIIMGTDSPTDRPAAGSGPAEQVPIGIGKGSTIERAILDTNCRVGRGVQISPPLEETLNRELGEIIIRDGITVLPSQTSLPDGWSLEQFLFSD